MLAAEQQGAGAEVALILMVLVKVLGGVRDPVRPLELYVIRVALGYQLTPQTCEVAADRQPAGWGCAKADATRATTSKSFLQFGAV